MHRGITDTLWLVIPLNSKGSNDVEQRRHLDLRGEPMGGVLILAGFIDEELFWTAARQQQQPTTGGATWHVY